MCDMISDQSAEKISRMKKLRRTLSESFSRLGECVSYSKCTIKRRDFAIYFRFLKKINVFISFKLSYTGDFLFRLKKYTFAEVKLAGAVITGFVELSPSLDSNGSS